MGNYLNPGIDGFVKTINSEIYIDKTGLLNYTNRVINTLQGYLCVSRPRRFGKSVTATMLAAYYSCECDSKELFAPFEIAKSPDFETYLNQYDTIFLNMQEFLSQSQDMDDMLALIRKSVLWELLEKYPAYRYFDNTNLPRTMQDIYNKSKRPFIVIIDEWDCVFREYKMEQGAQEKYLDFLRDLLKDKAYIHLAYMTGILPIKKYGTHSALNMFDEFSMLNPGPLASYVGFTETEVEILCKKYEMSFEEASAWYNGYHLISHGEGVRKVHSMYSPKSVVEAMMRHKFGTYWNQTETYEALKIYIQINMDGLKDAVIEMLGGGSVRINIGTFGNDMTTFANRDDILTLLVHLGYLTYDSELETVSVPDREVAQEYVNAITTMDWHEVTESIQESRKLLEALWNLDGDAVARGIDKAHKEISILQYNDENSLSCTVHLAFYFAREYYTIVRELPTGKGYADICFIPRKLYADKPAVVIELKWDKSAEGAIAQIKNKEYVEALKDYHGNLLLAGINYDKKEKEHTCVIEQLVY